MVGELRTTIKRSMLSKRKKYLVQSKLNIDSTRIGINHTLKTDADLHIDELGLPVAYKYNAVSSGTAESVNCEFKTNEVITDIKREKEESSGVIALNQTVYSLDRNMMGQWAVVFANLPLAIGKRIHLMGFVPQRQALLPIRIDVSGKNAIIVDEKKIVCYICDVFPLGETFYVSMDRRLVRVRNDANNLTIDNVAWLSGAFK